MNISTNLSVCVLIISLISSCAGASKTIEVSSLMQKKRHHEVIQILQQDVDRQENISSFNLYLLAGAYYEIRDYENMFKTVDLLDSRIAQGDTTMFGSDLTVYPGILRGYAFLDQGEYLKAVKVASEAHTLLQRTGGQSNNFYRSQLIDIAGILGVAHANLNQDAEADHYLAVLKNIDIRQSILGPEKYIAIARIHMAKKQYQQALSAIRNPDAKVTGLTTAFYDQTFQELPKFFIWTKSLYETDRLVEAREGYDQLLKHPQIKQVGGLYWPVLLDRARIARKEGQDEIAERLLREAVEVIEKQRASITTEAGRIGYVGDKQAVYQELIVLLIDAARTAEAFEYVERAKGRALVDLLSSQKHIAIHERDVSQTETTFRKLAKAETDLSVLKDPGIKQDPSGTRGVLVALKRDLASQAPEFTSLVAVAGTPLSEIQSLLLPNETLVEYYAADRAWFVFVLKPDRIVVKKLGSPDLAKDVREFRNTLMQPSSTEYVSYSRNLHRKLIVPVSDLLKTENLIIVPHGPLHYLPFGALSAGEGYLIDHVIIRMLPSASILKFLTARKGEKNPRILILGNPDLGNPKYDLKYAQNEAQTIAATLPGATVLLREEARATFVKKNANQYNVLHFAAHALFDAENPLNSALLLAPDKGNNGWLRAGDLYNLTLNADLVTLSACETALGKITKGDDVVGFTRGFLYAGTNSIVSSLWQVDDQATSILMQQFYKNLETNDKRSALRKAQLKVKNTYNAHPYYWAAFQITGTGD